MLSLDESLVDLYRRQVISRESLFNFCADRQEVEKLVGGAGPKASRQPYVPAS
jgi:twitching motility protein PilT